MTFFKCWYPIQLLRKILKIWFHIWIALEMYFRIDTDRFFSIFTPSPLKMGAKLGNISKIAWLSNYYLLNHSTVFIFFCIKIEYHKTFKMMMSFFCKNAFLPPKRVKRSKTGQSIRRKSTLAFFQFSPLYYVRTAIKRLITTIKTMA